MSEWSVWVKAFCVTMAVFIGVVLETAIVMSIVGGVVWAAIQVVIWIMSFQ